MDILEQALAELARHVPNLPLVIGGGFGLVLRIRQIQSSGQQTLRPVPQARSTEDMDLFLTAEIIADGDRVRELRDALTALGYESVKGAEHYQFSRSVDTAHGEHRIKIDILAPIPTDAELLSRIKQKDRRIRPRSIKNIHAHVLPEACSVGQFPVTIGLADGIDIYVPHPYSFVILKLFAMRDRLRDSHIPLGRKHAFDIYSIIATFTSDQWEQTELIRRNFSNPDVLDDATDIVHTFFQQTESPGTMALLNQARLNGTGMRELDVEGFLRDLHELFPASIG